MRGGTAARALDDALHAEPLRWMGLYVAAVSFFFAAAMAYDAYCGFSRRMPWFPARRLSLDATTITLLGVAIKFPMDLTTSMPSSIDQLTKLSGTTLLCTVMANFLPSLGMDHNAASDVVAVGIVVVTVIVHVCIQMFTGVIYAFLTEHIIMMILLIAQLVVLISSALSVKTTRQILRRDYHDQCKLVYADTKKDIKKDGFSRSNLETLIKKAWLMAQTYRPQYGVSAMGSASAVLCLLAAINLMRALFINSSISGCCSVTSDYRWSTTLVLIVQATAVVIGTVAPVSRWLYRIHFKKVPDEFRLQERWVMKLKEWKTPPSAYPLTTGWGWKIADRLKNSVLDGLIWLQWRVVLLCKLIHLAPTCLHIIVGCLFPQPSPPDKTLKKYVLQLDWERDWRSLIMKSELKDMEELKQRSRKDQSLVELIQSHSTVSAGFKDVLAFYGDEPLNCWALPLVTLVSIAVALPGICRCSVGSLLRGVKQGLEYVKLVDRNLCGADWSTVTKETEVADTVWSDLNNNKWFNLDWHGSRLREKSGKQRIQAMGHDASRQKVRASKSKVSAFKCMNRACTTILKDYDDLTEEELFTCLRTAISDILGACLTNLQRAISVQCFKTSLYSGEERETSARDAVSLFGQVEEILDSIEDARRRKVFPDVRPRKEAGPRINDWRICPTQDLQPYHTPHVAISLEMRCVFCRVRSVWEQE